LQVCVDESIPATSVIAVLLIVLSVMPARP